MSFWVRAGGNQALSSSPGWRGDGEYREWENQTEISCPSNHEPYRHIARKEWPDYHQDRRREEPMQTSQLSASYNPSRSIPPTPTYYIRKDASRSFQRPRSPATAPVPVPAPAPTPAHAPLASWSWSDGSDFKTFESRKMQDSPYPSQISRIEMYPRKEQHPFLPQPEHSPVPILVHSSQRPPHTPEDLSLDDSTDGYLMTDEEAMASVARHVENLQRWQPASRHARILRGLINATASNGSFELDDAALASIFLAANKVFFGGRLAHRVRWGWSHAASSPQYERQIIGHTSLRRANRGGFETFVLLSTPILKNPRHSRRLLVSAFLHELIHCYLFICCGGRARQAGGHTPAFHGIADIIDRWAGRGQLHLCDVEADLARFRQPTEPPDNGDYACPQPYYYDDVSWTTRL